MRSSQGVIDPLSVLSDALDGPLEDLPVVFRAVAVDLAGAMPVLLGMTVIVHVDGTPVVLNSVMPDNAVPVRASLLLSLLPLGVATTTGSVGFYSEPRARSSPWPTMFVGFSTSMGAPRWTSTCPPCRRTTPFPVPTGHPPAGGAAVRTHRCLGDSATGCPRAAV